MRDFHELIIEQARKSWGEQPHVLWLGVALMLGTNGVAANIYPFALWRICIHGLDRSALDRVNLS